MSIVTEFEKKDEESRYVDVLDLKRLMTYTENPQHIDTENIFIYKGEIYRKEI